MLNAFVFERGLIEYGDAGSRLLEFRLPEFASVELVGSDEYYESNSHNEKRGSYIVVNGSIGYQLERWTITLWAKNLLDEAHEERVFLFDNFDPDGRGEQRYEASTAPRSFGVTANYRW